MKGIKLSNSLHLNLLLETWNASFIRSQSIGKRVDHWIWPWSASLTHFELGRVLGGQALVSVKSSLGFPVTPYTPGANCGRWEGCGLAWWYPSLPSTFRTWFTRFDCLCCHLCWHLCDNHIMPSPYYKTVRPYFVPSVSFLTCRLLPPRPTLLARLSL